jgi:hypothetical protein
VYDEAAGYFANEHGWTQPRGVTEKECPVCDGRGREKGVAA